MFAWNWASFIAFGVYAGWSAKSTTVILRKTGPSSVTSKRLVGGATGSHDFNTAQVVRVELITAALDSTPQQEQTPSRRSVLKLILNDNSEVVLGEKTRSSGVSVNGVGISNFLEAPLHKEAQTVADFLGVPLGAADMSNPITALQSAIHPSQAPATQYSVARVPPKVSRLQSLLLHLLVP